MLRNIICILINIRKFLHCIDEICHVFCIMHLFVWALNKAKMDNQSYLCGFLLFFFFFRIHHLWSGPLCFSQIKVRHDTLPLLPPPRFPCNSEIIEMRVFLLVFVGELDHLIPRYLENFAIGCVVMNFRE